MPSRPYGTRYALAYVECMEQDVDDKTLAELLGWYISLLLRLVAIQAPL